MAACLPTDSGSVCSLVCNVGFSPSPPDAVYTCVAGVWDTPGHTCSPSSCSTLPGTPPNSHTALMTSACLPTSSSADCALECLPGFDPVPSDAVYTCTGGLWDSPAHSCIALPCVALPATPVNADLTAMAACLPTPSLATCDLRCVSGFSPTLPGGVYTCTLGSWDDSGHTCTEDSCTALPTDLPSETDTTGMAISCLPSTSGSTCLLLCVSGFSPEPVGAVYSCSTGSWDTAAARCVPNPCTTGLLAPANADTTAMDDCIPTRSGATCPLVCQSGTTPSPAGAVYACRAGAWDSPQHACGVPIACEVLPDVPPDADSAAMEYACNQTPTGGSCPLVCNDGFGTVPLGAHYTCTSGAWDPSAETLSCAPPEPCMEFFYQELPPNADMSTMNYACSPTASGMTCDLVCLPGYTVLPASLAYTCVGGTWDQHPDASCDMNPCTSLPSLPSGSDLAAVVAACTPTASNTACPLVCLSGFIPLPSDAALLCSVGTWDSPDIECIPESCSVLPPTPPNTNVGAMTSACLPAASAKTCPLECNIGYAASPLGAAYTCINTMWSSNPAVSCEPISCNSLPTVPPNADIKSMGSACLPTGNDSMCTLLCAPGHVPFPDQAAFTCTSGIWDDLPQASCMPMTCESLPIDTPMNADSQSMSACLPASSGSTCVLQCMEGFSPSVLGAVYTCQDGFWNTAPATCAQKTCNLLPPTPQNADTVYMTTMCLPAASSSACSLQCQTGFRPSPSLAVYTCVSGEWGQSDILTCVPDRCTGLPPLPLAADVDLMNAACVPTQSGFSCPVICSAGLVPALTGALYTCIDGVWDDPGHSCLASTPVPGCVPKCPSNSTCIGGNLCECMRGFGPVLAETSSSITCSPTCSPICHPEADCTLPDVCQCRGGWLGDGRNCVPDCNGVPGGSCAQFAQCTGPDECTCDDPYVGDGFTGGEGCTEPEFTCQGVPGGACHAEAVCVAQDTCECNAGFRDNTTVPGTDCAPNCINVPGGGCHVDALCLSPDVCSCNAPLVGDGVLAGSGCSSLTAPVQGGPSCGEVSGGGCQLNAECVAQDVCQCKGAYIGDGAIGGTGCVPDCSAVPGGACHVNASCISPSTCLCNTPFLGDGAAGSTGCNDPNTSCVNVAGGACSPNATCISEDLCRCNSGFAGDAVGGAGCSPVCDGVPGGACDDAAICDAPDSCVCTDSAAKGDGTLGGTGCSDPSGSCDKAPGGGCHKYATCVHGSTCTCIPGYSGDGNAAGTGCLLSLFKAPAMSVYLEFLEPSPSQALELAPGTAPSSSPPPGESSTEPQAHDEFTDPLQPPSTGQTSPPGTPGSPDAVSNTPSGHTAVANPSNPAEAAPIVPVPLSSNTDSNYTSYPVEVKEGVPFTVRLFSYSDFPSGALLRWSQSPLCEDGLDFPIRHSAQGMQSAVATIKLPEGDYYPCLGVSNPASKGAEQSLPVMFPVRDSQNGCSRAIHVLSDGRIAGTVGAWLEGIFATVAGLVSGRPGMGLHAMRALRASACENVEVSSGFEDALAAILEPFGQFFPASPEVGNVVITLAVVLFIGLVHILLVFLVKNIRGRPFATTAAALWFPFIFWLVMDLTWDSVLYSSLSLLRNEQSEEAAPDPRILMNRSDAEWNLQPLPSKDEIANCTCMPSPCTSGICKPDDSGRFDCMPPQPMNVSSKPAGSSKAHAMRKGGAGGADVDQMALDASTHFNNIGYMVGAMGLTVVFLFFLWQVKLIWQIRKLTGRSPYSETAPHDVDSQPLMDDASGSPDAPLQHTGPSEGSGDSERSISMKDPIQPLDLKELSNPPAPGWYKALFSRTIWIAQLPSAWKTDQADHVVNNDHPLNSFHGIFFTNLKGKIYWWNFVLNCFLFVFIFMPTVISDCMAATVGVLIVSLILLAVLLAIRPYSSVWEAFVIVLLAVVIVVAQVVRIIVLTTGWDAVAFMQLLYWSITVLTVLPLVFGILELCIGGRAVRTLLVQNAQGPGGTDPDEVEMQGCYDTASDASLGDKQNSQRVDNFDYTEQNTEEYDCHVEAGTQEQSRAGLAVETGDNSEDLDYEKTSPTNHLAPQSPGGQQASPPGSPRRFETSSPKESPLPSPKGLGA
eukprot:gene4020-735_t